MSKSVNWDPEEDDIIRNLMKYGFFFNINQKWTRWEAYLDINCTWII